MPINHLAAARIAHGFAARLASRERCCFVCENPPPQPGYHLWVADDDGALILAEQIEDWEAAVWLAVLVNQALAAERAKREARL